MEEKRLLEITLQHLSQAVDMLDMMSLTCTSIEKAELIGPIEILKRDLEALSFQIDECLYPQVNSSHETDPDIL